MCSRVRRYNSGKFFITQVYPKVIKFFANVCFALIQDNFLYVTIFVNYYLVAVIIDFLVTILLTISMFFYSPSDYCQGTGRNYEICVSVYITLRVVFTLLIVFADIMQVFNDLSGLFFMHIIFTDDCFASNRFISALQSCLIMKNSEKKIMKVVDSLVTMVTTQSLLQHMVRFQIKHSLMV